MAKKSSSRSKSAKTAKRAKPVKSSPASKRAKPIPDGMHTVTPHLVCAEATKALEFYKVALGAKVVMAPLLGPDGKVMHASFKVGDSVVMLADEYPDWGSLGPKTLKGTPVTLHLYVKDADAASERAVKAGATVKMPVQDTFWGDRYGIVEDPFGHSWAFATHIRDLSPKQIVEAAKTAFSQDCNPPDAAKTA